MLAGRSPLLALHFLSVWLPLGCLQGARLGVGQRLHRLVKLDPVLCPVDVVDVQHGDVVLVLGPPLGLEG